MSAIDIKALNASPDIREALSEILVEAVASGGSVSFMHPLASEVADTFWKASLAAAARGEEAHDQPYRAAVQRVAASGVEARADDRELVQSADDASPD